MDQSKERGAHAAVSLWQLPRCRRLAREWQSQPLLQALAAQVLPDGALVDYAEQEWLLFGAFQRAAGTAKSCAEAAGVARFEGLFDEVRETWQTHFKSAGSKEPLSTTNSYIERLETAADPRVLQQGTDAFPALAKLCAAMLPCLHLRCWVGAAVTEKIVQELGTDSKSAAWLKNLASPMFAAMACEVGLLLEACIQKAQTGGASPTAVLTSLAEIYTTSFADEIGVLRQQALVEAVPEEKKGRSILHFAKTVPPRVLIVAGSDSGGGAGIQADIKSCTMLGVFSTTAITALTAQNSLGVQGIFPVPIDFVQQQMRSVLDDLGTDVVKTGMLATADIVDAVTAALRAGASATEQWRRLLVVDPVMVSTSGHVLLEKDAIESVKSKLFPLASIVTPNLPEARLLLGRDDITSVEAMESVAKELAAMGPEWVLVKGGHMSEVVEGNSVVAADTLTDVLCNGRTGECVRFTSPRIATSHTHGTGCTLASSIAALLAAGHTVPEAVHLAREYVGGAIVASAHLELGSGAQGPMNHSWRLVEW